jgi:WD40 repeat protein
MSVAFSRDDSELATGSDDRTVRVWKLATGASEERAHHVSGGVNAVVRGHASDLLISSGWDFAINIAPATSWFESHSVHALALSNDDRVIAAAGDFGEVHLWDVSTHKLVARLDFAKRTTTLAFSHDGRWLLSAGQNKLPVLWDVRSLPRHVDGVGHRANVVGVAFTQDGSKFATSSDDNTLRLWDTPTGDELARIATASPCVNPVILRSGELVASCDDKTLRRWSTDGVETGRIATDVWLRFSALSPDGKTLAAGHMRGRMALVDVATWKVTKEITAHAHQIYTLDYAPTGELVTSGLDAHVKIWSPTLALLRDVTSKGTGVFGAAIDPAHEHIVAVSQDGAFEAWHFADAAPITRTQLHEGAIWKLVYARGTIYTASEDGTAKLVEPKTWRLVRTLEPGEGALDALGVSPDGKTLVVGSRAGGIVLYDTATWKPRRRIGGHARDHGSCDDVAAQAWADDTHRAIVLAACNSDAASYLARYAKLSHQQLRGDVDVASEW